MSYYDQRHIWEKPKTLEEVERLSCVISIIPCNIKKILDAGCGDGRICNNLTSPFTVGLDLSLEPLKQCVKLKLRGSVTNLPFQDKMFDCIILGEILEHLDDDSLIKAIGEVERVTCEWIIISVPYEENLNERICMCPKCGTEFHGYYHQRSFNLKFIKKVFNNFIVSAINYSGLYFTHNKLLIKLLKVLGYHYHYNEAICPNCRLALRNVKKRSLSRLRGWAIRGTLFLDRRLILIKKTIRFAQPLYMVILLEKQIKY